MLSGAILAGGQNRRMGGKPKSFLRISNETFIERQIKQMLAACSQLQIVTNQPELYAPFAGGPVSIVEDIYPHHGPLSGMHSALLHSIQDEVWIVACDMPFVCAQAALLMGTMRTQANSDAVIPVIGDKMQPMHGIYHRSCADTIAELIREQQYRVMGLFDRLKWQAITEYEFIGNGIDTAFITNVNTPADFEYVQSIIHKKDKKSPLQ